MNPSPPDAGGPMRAPEGAGLRARLRPPRSLRPTRAGWTFFAITLGVGFAALNTGNNLLYLVLSLMLAFLTLSGFLSEVALRGVAIERRLPKEIFAGLSNRVELLIRKPKGGSASYALVIEDRVAGAAKAHRRRHPMAGRCFALRVEAGSAERRSYAWTPTARGYAEFTGFVVSTRFPFALFVKSMQLSAPARVLVYPSIQPLAAPLGDGAHDRPGESRSGAGRDGAERSGLREFVEGDSARRIHWRSSIRRGELLVGEIEPENDAEIEVLLRTRTRRSDGAPGAEKIGTAQFEERVRWAASEVVSHLEAGRRVALRTDSKRLAPGTGPAQRARLLGFLATVEPEPVDDTASRFASDQRS